MNNLKEKLIEIVDNIGEDISRDEAVEALLELWESEKQ